MPASHFTSFVALLWMHSNPKILLKLPRTAHSTQDEFAPVLNTAG